MCDSSGVSVETVQKIDKKFLDTGTREQLKGAVVDCLDVIRDQSLIERQLRGQVAAMDDELRRLRGEKKSPSSGCLILRSPGAA